MYTTNVTPACNVILRNYAVNAGKTSEDAFTFRPTQYLIRTNYADIPAKQFMNTKLVLGQYTIK